MPKLWGGRFAKGTDKLVEDFHSSIVFDQRLYKQDIKGSIAHATMLGEQGIISQQDARQLVEGLEQLLKDIEAGKVEFDLAAEDIHMNIETLLTERIGTVGKKLHTARSRNDQVALDVRLYLREEIENIINMLFELIGVLSSLASEHTQTIMPGYTHLQRAQPITLAHHLIAYISMFQRDIERLRDGIKRTNICPLGSGALAGTTFNLNRERVAELLNFKGITNNSLDGVSDRDFIIEFCSAASMIMMHLSRFSEEIILWSSGEFCFIELDDAYSTGSSIMPQKKNPDVAELVRGKTGRVYGDLLSILTVMKGLPLAYNKDMQEDKEALFDAIDTVKGCLLVFAPMLSTMTVKKENMMNAAQGGFTNATDLADYLAKKGVPFREAHEVVGKAVLYCIQNKKVLEEVSLEEYRKMCPIFEEDLYIAINVKTCVEARKVAGGPSAGAVEKALQQIEQWMLLNKDK